jgi:alpha-beta hydrolase superfamily lysophospholipase
LHHAQYFVSKGYNVVTFDWRGFGESDEWEMNTDYLVYSELLPDYDAAIKTVLMLKQALNKKDTNLIVPYDYLNELQPIFLAPDYQKATLLIVGEKDDRTPTWMSEKIYSKLPSTKELWIVEGAEHGGSKGPLRDFGMFHE